MAGYAVENSNRPPPDHRGFPLRNQRVRYRLEAGVVGRKGPDIWILLIVLVGLGVVFTTKAQGSEAAPLSIVGDDCRYLGAAPCGEGLPSMERVRIHHVLRAMAVHLATFRMEPEKPRPLTPPLRTQWKLQLSYAGTEYRFRYRDDALGFEPHSADGWLELEELFTFVHVRWEW